MSHTLQGWQGKKRFTEKWGNTLPEKTDNICHLRGGTELTKNKNELPVIFTLTDIKHATGKDGDQSRVKKKCPT